jgi:hypothetical protein
MNGIAAEKEPHSKQHRPAGLAQAALDVRVCSPTHVTTSTEPTAFLSVVEIVTDMGLHAQTY